MTQDDHRVISLDEARRRRRARELREAAERDREAGGGEEHIRISDAMSLLLEGGEEPVSEEGPSAEHLRHIVEREFAVGDERGDEGGGPAEPGS